jgi:hypothetical protein
MHHYGTGKGEACGHVQACIEYNMNVTISGSKEFLCNRASYTRQVCDSYSGSCNCWIKVIKNICDQGLPQFQGSAPLKDAFLLVVAPDPANCARFT